MVDLNGRHVLITGAAGALGSAVSARARELGAQLTLVDIAAPAEGGEERWIELDLLDRDATREELSAIGPVDALVHLTGGFDMGPKVHELSPGAFDRMVAINVTTLQNVVHAVVPAMREQRRGAIVTVGALSALKGQAGVGAYCAAKSMVMRLSESMAAELLDDGITVNSVLPSLIDTPANRRDMPDADFTRWVSRRELADVICFLASSAATGVTGALIPVPGRV